MRVICVKNTSDLKEYVSIGKNYNVYGILVGSVPKM